MNKKNLPEQVKQVISIAENLFEDKILGMYLYGSYVLGGLQPNSDLDILILTKKEISDTTRIEFTKNLMKISGAVGNLEKRPLEIAIINQKDITPLKFPPRCEYMYGEWRRKEMEKGEIPKPFYDFDIIILLWQVKNYSITIKGKKAENIIPFITKNDIKKAVKFSFNEVVKNIKGDERNVLLTLARMYFTLETGEICSKNIAGKWCIKKLPNSLIPVMQMAVKEYLGEVSVVWDNFENEVLLLTDFLKNKIENI